MQTAQTRTQVTSARTPSHFETDIKGRMERAASELSRWANILDILEEHHFAPAALVYDFMNKCPPAFEGRNLRLELVNNYRSYVEQIDFDPKDPSRITGRLAVLILLSSYYSPAELLKQKALVLVAYKALGTKVPQKLIDRIALCDRHQKDRGGYSEQDFLSAGYVACVSKGKKAFTHEATGDTIIIGEHKLLGGALLTPEETEKRRLANIARRNEGRAKRFAAKASKSPKIKVPKKEEDKKGKKK